MPIPRGFTMAGKIRLYVRRLPDGTAVTARMVNRVGISNGNRATAGNVLRELEANGILKKVMRGRWVRTSLGAGGVGNGD